MTIDPKTFLTDLFDTAVKSVGAAACLPQCLPSPAKGRTIVVGAGKAAAQMAAVLENSWPAEARNRLSGLVVTRYGHGADCELIEVIEASHPVPDAAGQQAASRMLASVQKLHADDMVLCLISGGGSSLLAMPIDGLALEDKQSINRALLRSGADITEMNIVRKHLSAIKGGRLALACQPAAVHTLVISDVPGDDPAVTASGPTLPDASRCADALAVLKKYHIELPATVEKNLSDGSWESPGAERFQGTRNQVNVIATAEVALDAAAKRALALGITPYVLANDFEGDASDVGKVHGAMALRAANRSHANEHTAFQRPCVLLSGGETTVTVTGNGRGGRNVEFLLSLALTLAGNSSIHALAADTDGIDGSEDNAGALLFPDTLARAVQHKVSARAHQANNDAYSFFAELDDLLMTGPTRTNVNDFRAILIL